MALDSARGGCPSPGIILLPLSPMAQGSAHSAMEVPPPPPPPTVDHPAKVGPSWSHTWVWVPAAPHTLCLSLVGPWGSRAVGKGLWGGGCEGAWC